MAATRERGGIGHCSIWSVLYAIGAVESGSRIQDAFDALEYRFPSETWPLQLAIGMQNIIRYIRRNGNLANSRHGSAVEAFPMDWQACESAPTAFEEILKVLGVSARGRLFNAGEVPNYDFMQYAADSQTFARRLGYDQLPHAMVIRIATSPHAVGHFFTVVRTGNEYVRYEQAGRQTRIQWEGIIQWNDLQHYVLNSLDSSALFFYPQDIKRKRLPAEDILAFFPESDSDTTASLPEITRRVVTREYVVFSPIEGVDIHFAFCTNRNTEQAMDNAQKPVVIRVGDIPLVYEALRNKLNDLLPGKYIPIDFPEILDDFDSLPQNLEAIFEQFEEPNTLIFSSAELRDSVLMAALFLRRQLDLSTNEVLRILNPVLGRDPRDQSWIPFQFFDLLSDLPNTLIFSSAELRDSVLMAALFLRRQLDLSMNEVLRILNPVLGRDPRDQSWIPFQFFDLLSDLPVTNQWGQACELCGLPAHYTCGECHSVFYCRAACQANDWQDHFPNCPLMHTIGAGYTADNVEVWEGQRNYSVAARKGKRRRKRAKKKHISRRKAREILRHGMIRGHPLTKRQKRYFGFIAGGGKSTKVRAKHGFSEENDSHLCESRGVRMKHQCLVLSALYS